MTATNISNPNDEAALLSVDLSKPEPDPTAYHVKVNIGSDFAERVGEEARRAAEAADRREQPKEYTVAGANVHLSFDERQMLAQAAEGDLVWPSGTFEHVTCSALAKQGLLLKLPGSFRLVDAGRAIVDAEKEEEERGEHLPDFVKVLADPVAKDALVRGGLPG